MKRLHFGSIASILIALLGAAAVRAADADALAILRQKIEPALDAESVKRIGGAKFAVEVEDNTDGVRYSETLQTQMGLAAWLSAPIFSPPTASIAALRSIRQRATEACAESGGELKALKTAPRQVASDVNVRKLWQQAVSEQLVGRFQCERAQGTPAFDLYVRLASGPKNPTIANALNAADDVGLEIGALGEEALGGFRKRAKEYAERTQALRSGVAPGMKVQVPASALPVGLLGNLDEPARRANAPVCALVVDVKPALVQIQVRTGAFFVPVGEILPQGEPSTAIRTGAAPQAWCVR